MCAMHTAILPPKYYDCELWCLYLFCYIGLKYLQSTWHKSVLSIEDYTDCLFLSGIVLTSFYSELMKVRILQGVILVKMAWAA